MRIPNAKRGIRRSPTSINNYVGNCRTVAEALDWGILIVAGASLIFAAMAFKMVRDTTSRIDGYLDRLPKNPSKVLKDPQFAAEVVASVITQDQTLPDGTPLKVTDVITGYMNVFVPAIWERFEAKIPEFIPMIMREAYSSPSGSPDPSTAGQALANQRWQGGLKGAKAAKKIAKATGAAGIAEKIQSGIQVVGALKEIKPLIDDLKSLKPGSGNGGEERAPRSSGALPEWRPPA